MIDLESLTAVIVALGGLITVLTTLVVTLRTHAKVTTVLAAVTPTTTPPGS